MACAAAETAQPGKVKDVAAGTVQAQRTEIKALEELRRRLYLTSLNRRQCRDHHRWIRA